LRTSSLLASALALLAVCHLHPQIAAADTPPASSCEADLTCARQTEAAVEHDFSEGPDLSGWRWVSEYPDPALVPASEGAVAQRVRDPVTGMELVLVPGACYDAGQRGAEGNEVCLAPFYMGAHEVTFEEYERFARATGRDLPGDEGWGRGRRPVIDVSVYDALNFARWLSRRTGEHYRLPTETEWEHAARAGAMTAYPWGEEIGRNRANCVGCGSPWDGERTAPVGSFEANAWGLHDVVGNVAEWTCSMRDPDPQNSFERCDSIFETRRRAFRNGSYSDEADSVRVAYRDWNVAMRRTDFIGFRLVRECRQCLPEQGPAGLGRVAGELGEGGAVDD
jgi:formylglycine-generating enzyme required for sulfatase activity